MKKKQNIGFTLIELLCVLVILALLAIIVGRSIARSVNEAKTDLTETQEKSILNAAEKWSLDHTSEFDDIEGVINQVGLDVVFILDVSGSMTSTVRNVNGVSMTRNQAVAEATNDSIVALYKGNINTRIGVVLFGNSGKDFLPLDKYERMSTYYLRYIAPTSGSYGTLESGRLVALKDGAVYEKNYKYDGSGTELTNGMLIAQQKFMDQTLEEPRIPVVIILTDGDDFRPSTAIKTIKEGRSVIETKYKSTMYVYTIGFGISNGSKAALTLNPTPEAIQYAIDHNTSAKTLAEELQATGENYDYADGSFIGAMDANALRELFLQISDEVVKATKITQVCVTIDELKDGGYLSKDAKINEELAKSTYVLMSENAATNQYGFSIAKTEEQKQQCRDLIAAKEERENETSNLNP